MSDNDNTATKDNKNNSDGISKNTLFLTPVPPPQTPMSTTQDSTSSRLKEEENGDDDEEDRANMFLHLISDILERKDAKNRDEEDASGHLDTISIASDEGDHGYDGDHDEENLQHILRPRKSGAKRKTRSEINGMDRQNDQTEEEYETVLKGPNNEIIAVVTTPFLNDETILQSLRATLYGTDQNSFDTSTNISEVTSDDQLTAEEILQEQRRHDPTVALFFKFFEFAQAERLKEPSAIPYMVLGLFSNLSDIRSDLRWAQDAAYRRQAGKPYVAWNDYHAKERPYPWFTCFLLVVCTLMMVLAFRENDWKLAPFRTNALLGPEPEALVKLGALKGRVMIEEEKWWLLVTPIFLHAGIIHLLLNAGMILLLCWTIECNHGWLHTALLFLLSGIFGNMISAILQPKYILVGASGGIYGLMGACVADIVLNSRFFFLVLEERAQKEILERKREKLRQQMKRNHERNQRNAEERGRVAVVTTTATTDETSASDLIVRTHDFDKIQSRRRRVKFWCCVSLVFDLFVNSLLGLLPFVDNFAHLGGMLFGFFVSLSSLRLLSTSSFDYRKKKEKSCFGRWCHGLRILALRCGGVLSALFLVFVAFEFLRRSDGVTSPCPNCRYASCMALPKPWDPNDSNNWWACDGCDTALGQVYWAGKKQEEIIGSVDIDCPSGNTIRADISDRGYTKLEQSMKVLPDLCREFCHES